MEELVIALRYNHTKTKAITTECDSLYSFYKPVSI